MLYYQKKILSYCMSQNKEINNFFLLKSLGELGLEAQGRP